MKTLRHILIYIFSICLYLNSLSQCSITSFTANGINVINVDTFNLCFGDSVILTASGTCGNLMNNNFNSGTIGTGWQSNAGPMFNNPCGAGSDGTTYLWIGSASTFPRDLTTIPFNVLSTGCTICFNLRFAVQGAASPCEGPDEIDEGVSLQYSVNNGPWRDIVYFRPDGTQQPSNLWVGQSTSSGSGNTPFTSWNNYCFTIPAGARSTNTRFRWHQEQVTDVDYDHWGIDNVVISCPTTQNTVWSNNIIGDTNIIHPNVGVTNISLTISDTSGTNSVNDTIIIITHPIPTSPFTIDQHICQTQNTDVIYNGNATANATYLWNFAGANVVSGTNQGPFIVNWTNAGRYDVSLKVTENNCTSQTTVIPIDVFENPIVNFTPQPTSGCNPVSIQFTDNTAPAANYWKWNFGDGVSSYNLSNEQNPSHTYGSKGIYSVSLKVITSDGCSDSLTMNNIIEVFQTPIAEFTPSPNFTTTDEPTILFINQSQYAATYQWNFGDPGSANNTSTFSSPYHDYSTEGNYTINLLVFSADGCSDETSRSVTVEQAFSFYVPNSFSPNDNLFNDNFSPKGWGINWEKDYEMIIFDRWGNIVFETHDYNIPWDGTINGNKAPKSSYVWFIVVYDENNRRHEYNGIINIIR